MLDSGLSKFNKKFLNFFFETPFKIKNFKKEQNPVQILTVGRMKKKFIKKN